MAAVWTPKQTAQIESQLKLLEKYEAFKSSARLFAFLSYIVNAELDGKGEELNQLSIAIEAFGRGSDFDPTIDSIVRVEAGRLRTRLREYYLSEGKKDPVQISLPKGRYRPLIEFSSTVTDSESVSKQDIRYCNSKNGPSIAYSIAGKGPCLVKVANWMSHLEYDNVSPVWRHWWRDLSERYRLIRYDERGCGLSDWEVNDFHIDAWVDDLESVVETIKLDRFPLLGISQGAAVAIAYAYQNPERVSHLVLFGGFALGNLKRNPSDLERKEIELTWDIIRLGWGQENSAFRKFLASFFIPDGNIAQLDNLAELQRRSSSPENAEKFMRAFNNLDVVDMAKELTVPTLILHSRGDLNVPLSESRRLAKLIRGSKLVTLESRNHIIGETEPAWPKFLEAVDQFLQE